MATEKAIKEGEATPVEAIKERIENKESFFARLIPLLEPSAVREIELAYVLAKFEHRAQTRKELKPDGTPERYFEHPRQVALIAIDEAGCVDRDVICAALMHDSLEDTQTTREDLEKHLGARVARIVIRLSKIPKKGYYERLTLFGEWPELLIKACDRVHNLRTLGDDPKFRKKQIQDTQRHFPTISRRLLETIPVQWLEGAQKLVKEIEGYYSKE